MEIAFREETLRYLSEKICDNQYQEQTAEMTIPESLPAMERIVDCFGTVLMQSSKVTDGSVSVSGGIQAGVLYVPEGADGLERIDVFLPFTVSKKLQTTDDTTLFYWGWLKSIEARFINARKLLVRANLGSELTLLTPSELVIPVIDSCPPCLQCKKRTYPMLLPLYAAQKEILIADEVLMTEQDAGADRVLKWSCSAEVEDSHVVGDKAVFKGCIRLKVLYSSENGKLSVWTGTVPYSQYAELGADAENGIVSVQPVFRHVEIDTDGQIDSRRLLLNLTLNAQILVRKEVPVTLTEDAYCLCGCFDPEWKTLEIEPCLASVQNEPEAVFPLPEDAVGVLDWTALDDPPALKIQENGACTASVSGNLLYYDSEHAIRSKQQRVELASDSCDGAASNWFCVWQQCGEGKQTGRDVRIPVKTKLVFFRKPGVKTLSSGTLQKEDRPDGPSLVVKAAEGELWDIAKDNRSTVEALRRANALEGDFVPEKTLLLIPTGRAVYATGEETE